MMQCNRIAHAESAHARSNLHNHTGGFMAEYSRRRYRPMNHFLYVGGANATNTHTHKKFIRPDSRNRDLFDAQIVWPAVHNRAHGFGNPNRPIRRSHAEVIDTDSSSGSLENNCVVQANVHGQCNKLQHQLFTPERQIGVRRRLAGAGFGFTAI